MTAVVRNNVSLGGVAGRRPMLFVHGLGGDQDLWHAVAAAFGTDHRLVSIDLVGAGGSERGAFDPERYGSLWGHADDVVQVCAELDLRDVVLVGHGAGAMIGALAASRAPDRFGALVLIAPSPRYVDDDGYVGGSSRVAVEECLAAMADFDAWCDEVPRALMGNADRPELGQRLVEIFRASDPETTRHLARTMLRSDHREDLAAVTTRSLVLQASEEPLTPLAVGAFVHARLPDSEFVVLRATGHFPHVSAPAETVAAIHGFLARGSSGPVPPDPLMRTDRQGTPTTGSDMPDGTPRHRDERRVLLNRRRSDRRMRLVQQVVVELAAAGDVAEVARVLTDATSAAFDDADSSVWLLDAEGSELVEVVPPGQTARRHARQLGTAETEALRADGVVVDDARRVMAAAARHGRSAVGALVLERIDTERFDPDERGLLVDLGRHAGHALDRALGDERRDALLSVVSHELRTPLTPIVGFSELALGRYPDLSDDTRHAFEVIRRNGEHLITVVEDLLNLTRAQRGSIVAKPREVELAPFVGRLLADLPGGHVGVRAQVGDVAAWVDPDHLTRIVTNLLSNAHRYGRPPVVVTLGAADDGAVSLAVADDGDGVPFGFVDRLFDPFTQAVAGDRHSTVGLGLGLSISRHLAVANGGKLAYDASAAGGACFVLSLPSDPASTPVRS